MSFGEELENLRVAAQRRDQAPHGGNRHSHEIRRDSATGDLFVSAVQMASTESPFDSTAEQMADYVRSLGCNVPEDYLVELVRAKHDPAAWVRHGEGQDAVTADVWRCEYRVYRDPRLAIEPTLKLIGERYASRIGTPVDKSLDVVGQDGWFVRVISDEQIGKENDGLGTADLIKRWSEDLEQTKIQWIRCSEIAGFALPWLSLNPGDIQEGTVSQGGAVMGRSDCTIDAQVEIGIDMRVRETDLALSLGAPNVLSLHVPSNHGQISRVSGTVNTSFTASWDIFTAKSLAKIFRSHDNVEFMWPDEDQTHVTLEIGGLVLGMIHGHQIKSSDQKSIASWWAKQSFGRTPIGDVDLLVMGHHHSFQMFDIGGNRTVLVAPALDNGSRWYQDFSGSSSRARSLSFILSNGRVSYLNGAN